MLLVFAAVAFGFKASDSIFSQLPPPLNSFHRPTISTLSPHPQPTHPFCPTVSTISSLSAMVRPQGNCISYVMESSSPSLTFASHEGYWPGMRKSLVSSGDVSTCVPACVCEEKTWCVCCSVTLCWKLMRKTASAGSAFMCPPMLHVITHTPSRRNPETLLFLCNPNCTCSSFTKNIPKQLQGNYTRCADKEPRVVSSGRMMGNPFQHPLWDYDNNILGFSRSSSPPSNHPNTFVVAHFSLAFWQSWQAVFN